MAPLVNGTAVVLIDSGARRSVRSQLSAVTEYLCSYGIYSSQLSTITEYLCSYGIYSSQLSAVTEYLCSYGIYSCGIYSSQLSAVTEYLCSYGIYSYGLYSVYRISVECSSTQSPHPYDCSSARAA